MRTLRELAGIYEWGEPSDNLFKGEESYDMDDL